MHNFTNYSKVLAQDPKEPAPQSCLRAPYPPPARPSQQRHRRWYPWQLHLGCGLFGGFAPPLRGSPAPRPVRMRLAPLLTAGQLHPVRVQYLVTVRWRHGSRKEPAEGRGSSRAGRGLSPGRRGKGSSELPGEAALGDRGEAAPSALSTGQCGSKTPPRSWPVQCQGSGFLRGPKAVQRRLVLTRGKGSERVKQGRPLAGTVLSGQQAPGARGWWERMLPQAVWQLPGQSGPHPDPLPE